MSSNILVDIFKWCLQNPTVFVVIFLLVVFVVIVLIYKIVSYGLNKKYQREFEKKFKTITTELGIIKTQQINSFDSLLGKVDDVSNILVNRTLGTTTVRDTDMGGAKINEISTLIKNSSLYMEEELSKNFRYSNEQLENILYLLKNISLSSTGTSSISEGKLNEILTLLRNLSNQNVATTSKISKTRRQEKYVDDSLRSIGNVKEYN